jgi:aquaporin Z
MDALMQRRLVAEVIGTFVLVLGGCGAAVLAGELIGVAGVSLAFGLTVLCGAYALGHVSGGHFNPAVTIGLATAKRFDWKDTGPYIGAQVVGAIAAAAVLWLVAVNRDGTTADALAASGFASNGFGDNSPAGYAFLAGLVIEIVLTAVFVVVILGVTSKGAPAGFAPLAIGFALTLIHLVSIPVTNTSVNPARSTGPALMALLGGESWPIEQLWLFWVAPIVGGALGAVVHGLVSHDSDAA